MSDAANWFYEHRGQRVGPVTIDELRQKRREGVIGDTTLVWHPEFGAQWRPMGGAVAETATVTIEPVSQDPVRKPGVRFAWALALSPILALVVYGIIVALYRPLDSELLAIGCIEVLGILFAYLDRTHILATGYADAPDALWGAIPPVYYTLRKKMVGKRLFVADVGVGLWLLFVGIGIAGLLGLAGGPGDRPH